MSVSRAGKSGVSIGNTPKKTRSLQDASGIPGPVQSLTATSTGNNTANVSWSAPVVTGDSAITGYTVTGGGTPSVSGTSATVTGLTRNSPYTFSVNATNAVGSGFAGGAAQITTKNYSEATGGTTTDVSNYNGTGETWRVHTFSSNGTFAVQNNGTGGFNTIVVGGGGGGTWHAGNAGAPGGGIAVSNARSMAAGSYPASIGPGGPGTTGNARHAGTASTFDGLTGGGSAGSTGAATTHNITGASVGYDGGASSGSTYGRGGADAANYGGAGSPGVVIVAYRIG